MNFLIQFFNYSVKRQGSYTYMHKHSMFEFVYYCSGSGYTTINGVKQSYRPGDFALIGPGVEHDEYREEDTAVFFFCFLHHMDNIRLATAMYRDDTGTVRHYLDSMLEEAQQKRSHTALKQDMLLQCALIEIDRMYRKEPAPGHGEILDQTIRYIQQYYADQINLTQLADMSGYSYDHFRHLFLNYMGVTPMNYIIHLRLEKAKKMLADKRASMTQISLECGFSSLSHFSTTFKKKIGKSPREFTLEASKKSGGK